MQLLRPELMRRFAEAPDPNQELTSCLLLDGSKKYSLIRHASSLVSRPLRAAWPRSQANPLFPEKPHGVNLIG